MLLTIGVTTSGGCRPAEPYQKPLTPVRIIDVSRRAVARNARYSASVEPHTRMDLAFKVGGYVRELAQVNGRPIQEGDRVSVGMALANVRLEDYDDRVARARSQVAEATAGQEQARKALDRATALFATRSITKPELEQAQAASDGVQAKLAGAQALVREAEQARGDTVLRSPLDGIVLRRTVEVGSLVGPGTPGFVLADTRTVKVVVGLPDAILRTVPVGTQVTVVTEAVRDRQFEGRVTKVSATADPRSRVFEVEVSLPNSDGALKPGMVASIDLSATGRAAGEALVLPLAAVVRSKANSAGYAVFVLEDRDGRPIARLRDVRLGDLVGNDIEVVEGVRAGDRVIVGGATIVADGEQVNPTR
jgi:multidrug efflux system membrane fusion protein